MIVIVFEGQVYCYCFIILLLLELHERTLSGRNIAKRDCGVEGDMSEG